MNTHEQLTQLIQDASQNYLKHAGKHGKMLRDLGFAFEKPMLLAALSYFDHNLSYCAKALGISRTTLYKKLKLHNIFIKEKESHNIE